jgi:hypothetical protein
VPPPAPVAAIAPITTNMIARTTAKSTSDTGKTSSTLSLYELPAVGETRVAFVGEQRAQATYTDLVHG